MPADLPRYRTLLRNEVLTRLQELEAEAGYQARCAQARRASSGPVSPPDNGATCAGDAGGEDDTAEMLRLLDAALSSFDRLFWSISAAELKGGAERLRAGAQR